MVLAKENTDSDRDPVKNENSLNVENDYLNRIKEITQSIESRIRRRGGAALNSSRELAYLSTISDVRELNCRVRNVSGWNLSAMAAESPKPSSRFERE